MSAPVFEYTGVVRRWNSYGDKVDARIPTVILASTKSEAREKARIAFDATYDHFRNFWSHDFAVQSVREVPAPVHSEKVDAVDKV